MLSARPGAEPARVRRRFTRLASRYDRVIARLSTLPRTLVHGEFYPSNVVLRNSAAAGRICPLDWELAAAAPGLMDLAALTSGEWSRPERRQMAVAYRDALEPRRGWPPSLPELLELLDYCQLHLAMQWLGWAENWSPPKMHRHDWLNELVRLAQRLGL